MPLGLAHELALACACFCALLNIHLGGEMPPWTWIAVATPFLSMWLSLRNKSAPAASGTVLAIAAVGAGLVEIMRVGLEASVLAFGIILVGVLSARLLTRETLAHDLQTLLIALLTTLAASVLNVGLSYAPLFIGYAVSAIACMATRHMLTSAITEGRRQNRINSDVEQTDLDEDTAVKLVLTQEKTDERKDNRLLALKGRRDVVTVRFFLVTALTSLLLLFSTALVFVAFPRISFFNVSFLRRGQGELPGSVSLGGDGFLRGNSSDVVARLYDVPYENFNEGLYLRAAVYDEVDVKGFRRSPPIVRPKQEYRDAVTLNHTSDYGKRHISYQIALQPVTGQILPILGGTNYIIILSGGTANPNIHPTADGITPHSEWWASDSLTSLVRYQVDGGISSPGHISDGREAIEELEAELKAINSKKTLKDFDKLDKIPEIKPESTAGKILLRIPDDTDPRVAELAQKIVGDAQSNRLKAERIREYLLGNYRYLLDPSDMGSAPLLTFLFERREGHCEYFAAAFALLLRSVGVPSRVVGGYQGGFWDDTENIVVMTGQNAHAWVEWFLPGSGWVVDDATPLATGSRLSLGGWLAVMERLRRFWDDKILDYSLNEQMQIGRAVLDSVNRERRDVNPEGQKLRITLLVISGGALAIALVFWLRKRRDAQNQYPPLTDAILSALARCHGIPLDASTTMLESWQKLPNHINATDRKFLYDVILHYEAMRFGSREMNDDRSDAAIKKLQRIPAPANTH